MANAVMPKTVLLVAEWLKDQTAVTAIVSNRVSYRLTGTYPAIRVTDLGPIERGPEEHLHRVQIECWAESYDVAEQLSMIVESVVPESRGLWPSGYCAGGAVESGPFANPDPNSGKFRHQLDLALWLYPPPVQVGL